MKTREVTRKSTRKVRSDKKQEIRPTMNQSVYRLIGQISYVSDKPMKDVGEAIIIRALKSRAVIEIMAKEFRYDFMWEDRVLFRGRAIVGRYTYPLGEDKKRLPSFKFRKEYHDRIHDLAYALHSSESAAAAFLLSTAIDHTPIVNQFLAFYVEHELLDEKRKKQLNEIIRYLNRNKKDNEKITLVELLSYFKDAIYTAGSNFKQSFNDWIDQHFSEE